MIKSLTIVLALFAVPAFAQIIPPAAPAPLAGPANPTHVVATQGTVQKLLGAATCGQEIDLTGPFTTDIAVYNGVTPFRPSCPVVIDGSAATGLSSILFEHNASNWILRHATLSGSQFGEVAIANADRIQIEDDDLVNPGTTGVSVTTSSNIWLLRNHVSGSGGDGFDIAASQMVVVEDNTCSGNVPVNGLHPDCIQTWNIIGSPLISDLWLLRNVAAGPTQGFDAFNGASGAETRVYIVGNTISTTAVNAGGWVNCHQCIMTGNVAYTEIGQPTGWGGARWWMTDAAVDTTPDSGKSGNVIGPNTDGVEP